MSAWGAEDDATLRRMIHAGAQHKEIAEAVGRSRSAVTARLVQLGLSKRGPSEGVREACLVALEELRATDGPVTTDQIAARAGCSVYPVRVAVRMMARAGAPIVARRGARGGLELEGAWELPLDLTPRHRLEELAAGAHARMTALRRRAADAEERQALAEAQLRRSRESQVSDALRGARTSQLVRSLESRGYSVRIEGRA